MLELLERQERLTVNQWKVVSAAILGTGRAGRLPLTRNPRYARLPTSPVDPVRTAGSDEESGSHMTPRWREMDSNFQFRDK
jgi:hypothetical protein